MRDYATVDNEVVYSVEAGAPESMQARDPCVEENALLEAS